MHGDTFPANFENRNVDTCCLRKRMTEKTMKNFKPGDLGEEKCYSMNDTDIFKEIKIQCAPNKSRTNDLWISLPLRYTTEQWDTRCKMGRHLIRFTMTNFPLTASIGMSICGA